ISKLNISDPLHLHPNDLTALTVVSIKLKGTKNYQVWSCAMLLALERKNKIGFIDGYCKRSNTDEVLSKQWDRVNAIVFGWILNSISEELFLGFKKHNQLLKLMQSFMGLDDSYMQIRSSILSRETLPDVRSVMLPFLVRSLTELLQGWGSGSNNNRPSEGSGLVCEDCGFNRHTIDRCFKIIAYPADFEKEKSGQNVKKQNVSNNNSVGKSLSFSFSDEQMATLFSCESGGISVTADFPVNSKNDADSNDNNFATKDEGITTLEENVFSEGNVDKNPNTVSQDNQNLRSGEIDRFKAILVAQGFGQKEGIDYEETFSRVVKMGDLDEDVYMRPPGGYFLQITNQSKFDYSLFTKTNKGVFLALLVYVDDIIITGNNVAEIENFNVFLKSKFMIKDLGKFKYFLGTEVVDTDKGSKKQNTLSKSSTEAEYRALASVTIEIVANPVFHERTKHLEIDLHFVREKVLKGVVKTVKSLKDEGLVL
nr:ribonuclease H-like domain-containing protein [Tanacetum cinerariifolium]